MSDTPRTGWGPGLLQDDDRKLSRALANTPHARRLAKEAAEALKPLNQCDGCMSNKKLRGKLHVDEDGRPDMVCQRSEYGAAPTQEAQPDDAEFIKQMQQRVPKL